MPRETKLRIGAKPVAQEDLIQLNLSIGALSDPIAKQLREQRLKFDATVIAHIQKDVHAYARLKVRSLLTKPAQESICRRIYENVAKTVAEHN